MGSCSLVPRRLPPGDEARAPDAVDLEHVRNHGVMPTKHPRRWALARIVFWQAEIFEKILSSSMKLLLILTLVGFFGVQAQNAPPAIVIRPPDSSTATETQTVRFTCAAYGVPTPTIKWRRGNEDLDILLADPDSGLKTYDQTMTVNGVVFAVSVLEMCGVNQTSSTAFTCWASNGVTGSGVAPSSGTFSLTVTAADQQAPAIVVRPSDQTNIDYGSTVEAMCVAYGNPLPTISWTKTSCLNCDVSQGMGDSLVSTDVVSYGDVTFAKSTLRLCNVEAIDSGTFRCTAWNGVGAQQYWEFQLSVNDQVVSTTSTAPTRTSSTTAMVAPTSETDRQTLSNLATERAYQVVVAIETIIIVFLIVVLVVLIFIAWKMSSKKEKATIEIPGFGSRPQATNPIYDEPPRELQQPQSIDNMTYAELTEKMNSGSGDDMKKSLID